MKKIIFILGLIFATSAAFATNTGNVDTIGVTGMNTEMVEEDAINCKVRVKGTIDGVEFDIVMEFDNVNLIECGILKAAIAAAL